MEASLTAGAGAAALSPPPQIRLRISNPNPLLPPRRPQFGRSRIRTSGTRNHLVAASASTPPAAGGGLYSAATYELTADNVDCVLDDVRPYLIADGGDVTVVSVDDGIISLKLEGEPLGFMPCIRQPFSAKIMAARTNLAMLTSNHGFATASRSVRQLPQLDDDDEDGNRARAQGEVWRRRQGHPPGVRWGPAAGGDDARGGEPTPGHTAAGDCQLRRERGGARRGRRGLPGEVRRPRVHRERGQGGHQGEVSGHHQCGVRLVIYQ
ncbi:hypothetical protein GUJ93_ZPchr0013g33794 [Zizania palustris]|uniref:NIF system FeS cluster assembly NifU C-terminal domain-containing protein n=1 Tax=Zizania palustris TaxID=103762 RepID=A0A8J6BXA6_ZIZPA|nr:hypothetical protein GUJ93_ZPchr0013g33794 [Zizania palustris]